MDFTINAKLAPGQIVYALGGIFSIPGAIGKVIACEVVNVRVGGDLIAKYYIRPVVTPEGRKRLHIITSGSCIGLTVFESKDEAEKSLKKHNAD